jgi:hypothetical protein
MPASCRRAFVQAERMLWEWISPGAEQEVLDLLDEPDR